MRSPLYNVRRYRRRRIEKKKQSHPFASLRNRYSGQRPPPANNNILDLNPVDLSPQLVVVTITFIFIFNDNLLLKKNNNNDTSILESARRALAKCNYGVKYHLNCHCVNRSFNALLLCPAIGWKHGLVRVFVTQNATGNYCERKEIDSFKRRTVTDENIGDQTITAPVGGLFGRRLGCGQLNSD